VSSVVEEAHTPFLELLAEGLDFPFHVLLGEVFPLDDVETQFDQCLGDGSGIADGITKRGIS